MNDEWHRQHSIFNTDFSKPPDVLVEEIRDKLSDIRGQLSDLGRGYSGFQQPLDNVCGLLTCGIECLYYIREEMKSLGLGANKNE